MSGLQPRGDMACPTHLLHTGERAIWWGRPVSWLGSRSESLSGLVITLSNVVIISGMMYQHWDIFTKFDQIKNIRDYNQILIVITLVIGFIYTIIITLFKEINRFIYSKYAVYILTDQRAIVYLKRNIKSFRINQINLVMVEARAGHIKDVIFYKREFGFSRLFGGRKYDGFIGITDGKAVAREMHRLRSLYP